ncbi:MAG: hypothetical protein KDA96_27895, partial [Planctomycetaceae bacterium]|nr:hypothetical protein [Planctomycetaceae bacterium]
ECPIDLAAWIQFLCADACVLDDPAQRTRVLLAGHSMGGVKAIYSQTVAPDARVCGIACLSPPHFCHQHWMNHQLADAFRESYQQARGFVESGRPNELMQCRQPVPFVATAAGFLAKYGPEDTYDILRLIPQLKSPSLVLLGGRTAGSSPAFDLLERRLRQMSATSPNVAFELLAGEDMSYSQQPEQPFRLISDWWMKQDSLQSMD